MKSLLAANGLFCTHRQFATVCFRPLPFLPVGEPAWHWRPLRNSSWQRKTCRTFVLARCRQMQLGTCRRKILTAKPQTIYVVAGLSVLEQQRVLGGEACMWRALAACRGASRTKCGDHCSGSGRWYFARGAWCLEARGGQPCLRSVRMNTLICSLRDPGHDHAHGMECYHVPQITV